jgi:diacylglycerol kinase family enzyme
MENGFGQDKKEPVLIVNPGSGGGSTGKDWETLFARIKEALGKEPHFVFTEKSRDGTTLARELIKNGYQYIVAGEEMEP